MCAATIISFDGFELDRARKELRFEGQAVVVEPQVFDLIECLASHPGDVLSRDDLIDKVWGGRIVSDSAIASRINAARVALGDDGARQHRIRTIPRRGYRFESEVRETDPSAQSGRPALPEKPSLAVLPFVNMSPDPEQVYFSDGITDDIITDLSRYNELFVIARQSSFAYRGSQLSAAQIAEELGVQYIADGSVRRAGNRVRVSVQLVDARAGGPVWADRYDRELEDIFAVQDEITSVIVNTLAGQIARQHFMRVDRRSAEAVDAYDHLARAVPHALKVSPRDNDIARDEALRAIEIDPRMARAHAILSLTYTNNGNNFWVEDPTAAQSAALKAAAQAVACDDRDPWGHAMHGIADLWLNRAHDRSVQSLERAIALNPSNAYFRGLCAYVLPFAGDADRALGEIEMARRMNPHFPAVFLGFRGRALLFLDRLDEALDCLEEMVTLMPGHSNALGYVAVAYAALDRMSDARVAVERLVAENAYYRLGTLRRYLPFRRTQDLDFMLRMLQAAGLPE